MSIYVCVGGYFHKKGYSKPSTSNEPIIGLQTVASWSRFKEVCGGLVVTSSLLPPYVMHMFTLHIPYFHMWVSYVVWV